MISRKVYEKKSVNCPLSLTGAFETVGKRLIGFKLVMVLVDPFFGREVTSAQLNTSGKVEFSMQSLKIRVKGSTYTS